jgi:hypothetical protein
LEKHLHYYQLIDLPPRNEREGGQLLEAIVKHNDAALVVIDTLSAVVEGDETATDTYTGLWRHTERRFKRLGITYIRLDHLGKDATRGSRGSSAKEDKLDIVWQLTQNVGGSLTFTRTKGRQPWIPETVTVSRTTTNGILTHETPVAFAEQWLVDLVYQIDELGLPEDAGIPTVQKNLRDSGNGRRRADIAKAVRFRKRRQQGVPRNPEHLGTPPRNTFGNTPEHPHRNPPLPGVSNRNSFGNTSEHPKGGVSPLEGEHPQGADDDFDAETDRIAGL